MAFVTVTQASSIWLAIPVGSLGPFGQTWSLSVEWYFYLAWPVILLAVKGRGVTARRMMILAVGAAALIYVASLFQSNDWFYFGPLARVAELLAGGALALLL